MLLLQCLHFFASFPGLSLCLSLSVFQSGAWDAKIKTGRMFEVRQTGASWLGSRPDWMNCKSNNKTTKRSQCSLEFILILNIPKLSLLLSLWQRHIYIYIRQAHIFLNMLSGVQPPWIIWRGETASGYFTYTGFCTVSESFLYACEFQCYLTNPVYVVSNSRPKTLPK